jgi:hypothetical protein
MKIPGIIVGAGGATILFLALRSKNATVTVTAAAAAPAPAPTPAPVFAPGPNPEPGAVIYRRGGAVVSTPPAVPIPAAPVPRPAPPPALRPTAKLGNADPRFESWLAGEVNTLVGSNSSSGGFKAADRTFLANAIRGRHIPDYFKNSPGDCGAPPQLGSFGVVQEVGGVASLGVSGAQLGLQIAGTAVKSLPLVGAAISIFESAYTIAFGHHQQAVKVEQNTLCNAIPLANQYMDQLDVAFRQGQLGGQQMSAALDAMYQKFLQLVAGIIKPTPFSIQTAEQEHVCNAACVYARALRGIIDAKEMFDY